MTKHEQYYSEMLAKHKSQFGKFKLIHQQYVLEPDKAKPEFDDIGANIVEIITEYENRLCAHSEKGKYGVFSNSLHDKFWDLVRKDFPKIDDVGIEVTYTKPNPHVGASRLGGTPLPKPKPAISAQSSEDYANAAIDEVLSSLKKTVV